MTARTWSLVTVTVDGRQVVLWINGRQVAEVAQPLPVPPAAGQPWFVGRSLTQYFRGRLGEMLVWWGIFVFAVPFLHGLAFLTVIGPVFITLLLLFVSGIPMLEKSAEARFGGDPEYREYKRRTSILVPAPRRR